MPIFLEQLIHPFYEQIGADHRSTLRRGQLCFTPVGYAQENLQVWRPTQSNIPLAAGAAFQLVAAPGDAFSRAAPLVTPPLETNEELLGVWAKRRPVIFVGAAPGPTDVPRVRGGGRVHRRLAVVIPV